MAKKHKHEEHTNHEAWAIPYGDLITLLLAFFVVMYAVSSLNEGKYRVASDAISKAFGGPPKSINPIQFGKPQRAVDSSQKMDSRHGDQPDQPTGTNPQDLKAARRIPPRIQTMIPATGETGQRGMAALKTMADELERALAQLIAQDLVTVRKTELWLEVEIKTDILFASGSARLAEEAIPTLRQVAAILKPYSHFIRVEGHTDNRPIRTAQFLSNWELSAARAASVVHVMADGEIAPERLSVLGLGEYRPIADNATEQGRNQNRRVIIVVLADTSGAREWRRMKLHPARAEAGETAPAAAPRSSP